MAELNLDAARAARAEVLGDAPTFTLGGETFTLPVELPMRYVWTLDAGDEVDPLDVLKVLLDGELDRFIAANPTRNDILALIDGIPVLYGLRPPGESPASAGSSSNGSNRSRPTSSASTASTSGRRAGARKR